MTRILTCIVIASVVQLVGCVSTERCPDGTGRVIGSDGRVMGECIPFDASPDAAPRDGGDAGEPVDGGPVDAGTDAESPTDAGPCDGACDVDHCIDDACVECTVATQATDCTDGDAILCDPEANTCVSCVTDDDCTEASAPICADNACRGCESDPECATRDASLPACLGTGACVECTSMERSACAGGANVCDGSTNECTTRPAESKGLCQDCVADAECMAGQVCVAMEFEATAVGQFCLWRQDATETGAPDGDCLSTQPYVEAEPVTSVDDLSTNVCTLRSTTCSALNQFDVTNCSAPVAGDDECGVTTLADGLCRLRSGVTNRCTIPCLSNDDCRTGSTCNLAATPTYCNF